MCPHCGVRTSAKTGEPTPQHQERGKRNVCPGVGQPAK